MSHDRWYDGEHGSPISWTVRGALWRLAVSVLAPIAWLCFTLLFFGFWAHGLSLAQDLIVGAVSVLTLLGVLLVVWVSFGTRLFRRWVDA